MIHRHHNTRRSIAVLLALVYLAFFTVAALHKDPDVCAGDRQFSFYSFALPEPAIPSRSDSAPVRLGSAETVTCLVCLWLKFGKDMPTSDGIAIAGETDVFQRLLIQDISVRLVPDLSPHAPRAPPAA